MPVGTTRRNAATTSSGRAVVARSQSFAGLPSRTSRTQPPTTQARWPRARSVSAITCTLAGIDAASKARGMVLSTTLLLGSRALAPETAPADHALASDGGVAGIGGPREAAPLEVR